jgi:hypothetical protein
MAGLVQACPGHPDSPAPWHPDRDQEKPGDDAMGSVLLCKTPKQSDPSGPLHQIKRRLRLRIRAAPHPNKAAQICSDAIGFSHRFTCVKRKGMTSAS